jgi:hypothetical protein
MLKKWLADKEDRITALEQIISRCVMCCSIYRFSKHDISTTQQHIECRKQLESDLATARSNAESREHERVSLQTRYGVFTIGSKYTRLILIKTSAPPREAFRISRCFKPNGGERRNTQSPGCMRTGGGRESTPGNYNGVEVQLISQDC